MRKRRRSRRRELQQHLGWTWHANRSYEQLTCRIFPMYLVESAKWIQVIQVFSKNEIAEEGWRGIHSGFSWIFKNGAWKLMQGRVGCLMTARVFQSSACTMRSLSSLCPIEMTKRVWGWIRWRLGCWDQLSLASPHTRLVPWFEQVTCLIWEAVCLVAPFSGMFTTMFRNVKPKLLPLS